MLARRNWRGVDMNHQLKEREVGGGGWPRGYIPIQSVPYGYYSTLLYTMMFFTLPAPQFWLLDLLTIITVFSRTARPAPPAYLLAFYPYISAATFWGKDEFTISTTCLAHTTKITNYQKPGNAGERRTCVLCVEWNAMGKNHRHKRMVYIHVYTYLSYIYTSSYPFHCHLPLPTCRGRYSPPALSPPLVLHAVLSYSIPLSLPFPLLGADITYCRACSGQDYIRD